MCNNELGVSLFQNSETEGEVNLLRSKYSSTRFAFSYAWWSAYGFERHCASDESKQDAAEMTLVNSESVYAQCGTQIKKQLLEGNAIVLFACKSTCTPSLLI